MRKFLMTAILTMAVWPLASGGGATVQAEIKMPAIFGSHMVLQREQKNPVWGWAAPGEKIHVEIASQSILTSPDKTGKWKVTLAPIESVGPHTLTVTSDKSDQKLVFEDVLIGEVWICSGQSNMAWNVGNSDDADLETLAAKYPHIRLISVPQVGTQAPQDDFKGNWQPCTPESVRDFSAVGYFFGRQLHQTLDVPIGLIDNAWGGSAAEAWVRRDLMEEDERFAELMQKWKDTEAGYDFKAQQLRYETAIEVWKTKTIAARNAGKPVPNRPRPPRNVLAGQHRPGNLYNGVLRPTIGYGIRGVIWYQGESNAGRAYQYRDLFPKMITHWREEWQQGDFPFYWVQLADYKAESPIPQPSDWAELREAQTMSLKLPNTGQAVIYDLGEADDIHPKNKQIVAKRLARWALAKDYGIEIAYRSPEYKSMEIVDDAIVVTFDHVGRGLDTFDTREIKGFAIAGDDRQWQWANTKIISKNQVKVWTTDIPQPTAVRYAWANNPVANLQSQEGLPATPFRSDDDPGVTADVRK